MLCKKWNKAVVGVYMKKKILIVFAAFFILISGIIFYLVNPNDPQYKSFGLENAALIAYSMGNYDEYFKNFDNPITVKYHFAQNTILANEYAIAGKYDDAQRVIESFKKHVDYSACIKHKPAERAICRIDAMFLSATPPQINYDKNFQLAKLYYQKGDYDKSLEYNSKAKKKYSCFDATLYARAGMMDQAEESLKLCEKSQEFNKNKKSLYTAQGVLFIEQKKYNEALNEFNKYLDSTQCGKGKFLKCRGNNEVYLYMAEALVKTGKNNEAKKYYEKVLKTEPQNIKAKNGLQLLKK